MSVQTCRMSRKSAGCHDAFGIGLASRWLGMSEADIEAKAGRFARGKHKGCLRGWIVWSKCEEGGWCFPLGCVIRPGMIFAKFMATYDDMCTAMNADTEKFMAGTKRVDRSYGYDPSAQPTTIQQSVGKRYSVVVRDDFDPYLVQPMYNTPEEAEELIANIHKAVAVQPNAAIAYDWIVWDCHNRCPVESSKAIA